jgi:hypothetical protein
MHKFQRKTGGSRVAHDMFKASKTYVRNTAGMERHFRWRFEAFHSKSVPLMPHTLLGFLSPLVIVVVVLVVSLARIVLPDIVAFRGVVTWAFQRGQCQLQPQVMWTSVTTFGNQGSAMPTAR